MNLEQKFLYALSLLYVCEGCSHNPKNGGQEESIELLYFTEEFKGQNLHFPKT